MNIRRGDERLTPCSNVGTFLRHARHAVKWRVETVFTRSFGYWLVDGWEERRMGRYIRRHAVRGTHFLDVGCGVDARLSSYLPEGVFYHGIDLNPDVVESPVARQLGRRVQMADAREVPFPDNSFSLIACMEVLLEIGDWERALDEMMRVLTPEGVLTLSIANAYCYKYAKKGPNPHRRSACTFSEYTATLEKHGLEVVESKMLGWWLPVLRRSKYSIMLPIASKHEFYNCVFFFVCRKTGNARRRSASDTAQE